MDEAYEQGKRDGKIDALEQMLAHHSGRLEVIESRQRWQERVLWTILGAIALINLLPTLKGILA